VNITEIVVNLKVAVKEFLNITVMEVIATIMGLKSRPRFINRDEKVRKIEPVIYKIS